VHRSRAALLTVATSVASNWCTTLYNEHFHRSWCRAAAGAGRVARLCNAALFPQSLHGAMHCALHTRTHSCERGDALMLSELLRHASSAALACAHPCECGDARAAVFEQALAGLMIHIALCTTVTFGHREPAVHAFVSLGKQALVLVYHHSPL
jgi:hypothetical protein